MVNKKIIKTVLVPGAPWPKYEKPKPKKPSSPKKTDELFDLWSAKQVGVMQ